jgi:large subunit ribosomal protein L24
MATSKIKKGDTVKVITGKDKGKEGKVISVSGGKVLVEGVNTITKHSKASQANPKGGIIHQEAPIYASKVMLVCPHCGKPTRLAHKMLENGDKARLCKKCGETF